MRIRVVFLIFAAHLGIQLLTGFVVPADPNPPAKCEFRRLRRHFPRRCSMVNCEKCENAECIRNHRKVSGRNPEKPAPACH